MKDKLKKYIKKYIKDSRGQSLVEMALVLPILLFLLFGIMEMGRLVEGYLELQNAARDGARYASIHSAEFPNSTMSTIQWQDTYLEPKVAGDLVMLKPADLSVQLTKNDVSTTDKWVDVTLQYNLKLITPLISDLIATDKANSTFELKAKMSMRGE